MARKTKSRIPYKASSLLKTNENFASLLNILKQSYDEALLKNNGFNERGSYRQQESLSDEITLRDEIFKLKQEMMILKRTNEQYLVKLRKYEDEVKRQDKHLEQLMDPRKNSDITKVLSTKGAAILMNLKDQNNSLIQMILNKDLHIRRLVAQIKMSKLYAGRNKTYRAEIIRLRNLLIKSQESLKENVDLRQKTRSICVHGKSLSEFSFSSDQSSPRDLEELRLTILNLESHIKYSNELLAEKNQKISLLTDELNFLRKFFNSKTSKNTPFVSDFADIENPKFPSADFPSTCSDQAISMKISNQDISGLFDKNMNQESDTPPHSAPAAFSKCFSPVDSTTKHNFQPLILEQRTENELESKSEPEVTPTQENHKELEKSASILGKSLYHNLTSDEIKKEETLLSNSKTEIRTREKWKKALVKYKELKRLNLKSFGGNEKDETTFTEKENDVPENLTDGKVEEFEETVRENQILEDTKMNSIDSLESVESPESSEINENRSRTPINASDGTVSDNETCQNSEKNSSVLFEDEDKSVEQDEPQASSDSEKEFSKTFEDTNSKNTKSQEEIYRQNSDFSSDSESNYTIKQMQVEVRINTIVPNDSNDRLETSFSENNLMFEYCKEVRGNDAPHLDFNDDDDVIVKNKYKSKGTF